MGCSQGSVARRVLWFYSARRWGLQATAREESSPKQDFEKQKAIIYPSRSVKTVAKVCPAIQSQFSLWFVMNISSICSY